MPVLALFALGAAACHGCHPTTGANGSSSADLARPSLRLYLVSDLAGALEPCGCTKDQLGGLDHAAAWMTSERKSAPFSAFVEAGPLFFLDSVLKDERKDQELAKAETLGASLKTLGLTGFSAGQNDWAGGSDELSALGTECGGPMLAANLGASPAWRGAVLREVNGVKVGFVGVSALPVSMDMKSLAPEDAVRAGVNDLKKQGAEVLIAVVSVGRGEAKRIADAVPELTAVVVGSQSSAGEGNTQAPPAERVGDVVIAQTANHLQTVGVLDLYVRREAGQPLKFADASGLDQSQKRSELSRRIDELHVKIAAWEKEGKVAKEDLDARRADLARLEAQRAALDVRPPPAQGSFFRYTVREIREALGSDEAVHAELLAYYKKVNDHNRAAFANRMPLPHRPDEPAFVGVEDCTPCHDSPREVWDKTKHATAYASLSKQNKEFNLDCVDCHVTGYDLPGGSTVTHVENLENVQCEVCHGPGSLHSKSPKKVKMPVPKPTPDRCLACHHPPHVEDFDAKAKMEEILGPGHGKPE